MKIERKKLISICVAFLAIGIILFAIFIKLSFKEEAIATNNVEERTYKKANIKELDLKEVINKNIQNPIKEEITTEEIDLEYTTVYQNSNDLSKGEIQVVQEGRDGKQTVVNKKTYRGEELIKEEQTGRIVTVSSIDKIVKVGICENVSNYKIKKGDTVYVASETLNVMQEKDKNSNKITTLSKENEVKVLQVEGEYARILYKSYIGWVDANCLKSKEEQISKDNKTVNLNNTKEKTKNQLLETLNEGMKLNKPSGLTLNQFKNVLSNNENDTNKVFSNNAEYFYYIEKQYNINGIFVAAVGIHESGWGTSKISLDKKNLFGYGASDSNPYNNAYSFKSYSEGIDLIARVFVKYYINPAGTKIYDNETASGKYYSGPTLASINKRYATDKNWYKGVYTWMEYLYNKL